MFAGLIQFALTQRLLTCLLALLLAGFGASAMLQLPIDAFPDISPTQVKVIIKAPGMTPEEVETLITNPLEVELLGIPQQSILRSISKYALSSITLDFEEGTDIYWARQQVGERLGNVWEELPGSISGGLAPMSTPLGDMFMFTIENPALSLEEKRFLLDWTIRPALRTVPGVADVNALGGYVRTFEVKPKRERMTLLGFTHDDLVQALELNNRNDGAGRIDQGEEAILVRVTGAIVNVEDLGRIQVRNGDGVLLPLTELAEVKLGELERYGTVTADGVEEAVQGLVISLRGANADAVVEGVNAKLAELEATLPQDTSMNVFYDRSVLIGGAVKTVAKALLEAVVLVVVLLGLFLGNVRAALTVALVLPLSALFTFILMNRLDMSANLMSLGGLVIAIGMLVDSSIVIVENVVSTLAHAKARRSPLPLLHLVFRAVKEVAVPVTSGIFIIMIVFLPLLSLEGLEGKLFRPVTLTIVFALAGSLLLSLTLIPVVASWSLSADAHAEPWLSRKLDALYRPTLGRALHDPKPVLAGAALLLVLTALLFPFVGKTFMPTMDEGDLIIQTESIPSVNLRSSTRQVLLIEEAIMNAVPEVLRVVSRTGSDEIGMDPMGLNETDMFLQLRPRHEWEAGDKQGIEDKLRAVMNSFPGINFGFTQPIDMRVSEMLTGSRGDVAIKIFGDDLDMLSHYADAMAALINQVPGSIDTIATINEGAQYLQVEVDRLRAGELGLDADALQTQLRAEIEGYRVGTVIQGSARVPLMLRYRPLVGDGETALRQNLVTLPDGGYVPLAEVARIQRVEGPVVISREGGQRFAVVRTNVEGRDLVGFVAEAQQAVARQLDLAEGYTLEWGGEFENQQRAAARLALVVPVALLLIAFILFLTFRSVKQTLIILSMIPFALTGGLIALWLTGEFLSVPASVGFIALLGIAVLNGVVMLSYFNQLLAKGLHIDQVVFDGALRRLRPVMMTASICALGLVPLLLATGPGSEIQKPLAIVVVGGLISSTVLTLFLMPLIYRHFHRTPAAA
ncbi:MAG TPA: CusA/CzcA family heavy metal efflux RND transporter [Hyphomicrobiales bacterium]|nr:CusA/CzcA family heavy metal efflux RND transporter [Hyphomicrobiales bacterium]